MKSKFRFDTGSVAMLLAVVFTIIAMIFGAVSNSRGLAAAETDIYGVAGYGAVVSCGVMALVLSVVAFVFNWLFRNKLFEIITDILRLAVAALLIVCLCVMISTRGDLMGYIWFSDLEAGNANAVSALYMALVSWIFYFLAIIAVAVNIYSDSCQKVRAPATENA